MATKKEKLTPEQISKICSSSVKTSKVHERRVATLLSEWSGVKFRRRRVTGRDGAMRMVEMVADVIPVVGDFKFSIECKKGKDFSLDGLMTNPSGSCFTHWWHQACYDASLVSGDLKRTIYPMMFFKPHPNWDWVAFSANSMLDIKGGSNVNELVLEANRRGDRKWWFPHLLFDNFGFMGQIECDVSHSKKHPKMVKLDLDPVVICRWRDFESFVCSHSAFSRFPDKDEIEKALASDMHTG